MLASLQAVKDFHERVRKYEEVYETLTNRNVHYIKVNNIIPGLARACVVALNASPHLPSSPLHSFTTS